MTIGESGSTLLYPLFQTWSREYAKVDPHVRITVERSDSEAGIAKAISGQVQIGASDAFMPDERLESAPDILNVPLAIAAVTVNYNVPGLNAAGLKLDGTVLAGIYSGTIRYWNDPRIASLNPGIALARRAIVPIHRSDGSGTTALFTQYLTYSTPSWEAGPATGTTIGWPAVPGAIAAVENLGMIQACREKPYSIAYVGSSLHRAVDEARLGTARLGNQAGRFLLPTSDSVGEAAATLGPRTPGDERLSLVYAPGTGSYPLVGYEYAIVSAKQSNARSAAAIRAFLLWVIDGYGGSTHENLDAVGFVALPDFVRSLSLAQIGKIR